MTTAKMRFQMKTKSLSLESFFLSCCVAFRVEVWGYIYPPHTSTQKHTCNATATAIWDYIEPACNAGYRNLEALRNAFATPQRKKGCRKGVEVFFATPYYER